MPPGQGASPGGGGAASLMVFLDANPVIYLIEQPANLGSKVTARVSDLLARYGTFFSSPDLNVLPVSPAVCDRAARIREQYGFKPLDSLHLAAAVEHGCTRFLSNDAQLKRFPDILVEILS